MDPSVADGIDDPRLEVVTIDTDGEAAEVLGVGSKSAYLVRPDHHVAARWTVAAPAGVVAALKCATGEVGR
jgi:3-(3-hydroxy-phenyl)propionate hydroxylase